MKKLIPIALVAILFFLGFKINNSSEVSQDLGVETGCKKVVQDGHVVYIGIGCKTIEQY